MALGTFGGRIALGLATTTLALGVAGCGDDGAKVRDIGDGTTATGTASGTGTGTGSGTATGTGTGSGTGTGTGSGTGADTGTGTTTGATTTG